MPNDVAFSDEAIRMSPLTSIFCFIRWKFCVDRHVRLPSCRTWGSCCASLFCAWKFSSRFRAHQFLGVYGMCVCVFTFLISGRNPPYNLRNDACKINRHICKLRKIKFARGVVPMSHPQPCPIGIDGICGGYRHSETVAYDSTQFARILPKNNDFSFCRLDSTRPIYSLSNALHINLISIIRRRAVCAKRQALISTVERRTSFLRVPTRIPISTFDENTFLGWTYSDAWYFS